jgi:hypothetical protein
LTAPAAHRDPAEEGFKEEGEEGGGEGVPLHGATICVYGGGEAVRGNVVGGRDAVEVCARLYKWWGAYRVGECVET